MCLYVDVIDALIAIVLQVLKPMKSQQLVCILLIIETP